MRVMGVDPGLTRCGLSLIESGRGRQLTALDVDVVRTPSDAALAQRLLAISDAVEHWLDTHHPEVVAIERVFSQLNVTTVMGTAQAGGVIALAAAKRGVDVHFHTPARSRRRSLATVPQTRLRSPRWSPKSLRCKLNRHRPTRPTLWRWRSVTVGGRRRSPGWLRPRRGRKHEQRSSVMRT